MNGISEKNNAAGTVEKVDFYYFTDPLCSHCWALDGVLNRIKHEYADHLNVITVMGGMMENPYGEEEAKDMIEHWAEVGAYYGIPIDGSVWAENPFTSSWTPSIAYLVLRERDAAQAARFLRRVREAAFVEKRNVGDRAVLKTLLGAVGAPADEILDVAFSEAGKQILNTNMQPMIDLGVSGFPTVVIVNAQNEGVKVIGVRTADTYRKAILRMMRPGTVLKSDGIEPLAAVLDRLPTLFDNEAEKIFDVPKAGFEAFVAGSLPAGSYRIGSKLGHSFVQKI